MTTPPSLPIVAGLTWSRHKKPLYKTRVAMHASGREVRVPLMQYALYEFEAQYDGLPSSALYASLMSATDLQTMMGFFLQMQGQANTFLYRDLDDNAVTGQVAGVGDGTTTSFLISRSLGGWNEPVSYVTTLQNVYLNSVLQASGYTFTAPNTLAFSVAPASTVVVSADFQFAFECRFLDDQMDFEEFMSNLWKLGSMKFRSVKTWLGG